MIFKIILAMLVHVSTSANSVKIRINKENFEFLQEVIGCILLAVVIVTTANAMHPAFSERHPMLFGHFRFLLTSHGDCRSQIGRAHV